MTEPLPANFQHGAEGTHTACNARLEAEGGKARCCYCVPHDNCEVSEPSEQPEHLKPKWAELVKTKREALGESQGKFGKRFGVSQAAVSDWERGVSDLPGHTSWWLIFARPEDTGVFVTATPDQPTRITSPVNPESTPKLELEGDTKPARNESGAEAVKPIITPEQVERESDKTPPTYAAEDELEDVMERRS